MSLESVLVMVVLLVVKSPAFVAAICETRLEAEAFGACLSAETRFALEGYDDVSLPCFLVESDTGFAAVDRSGLEAELQKWAARTHSDEEWVFGNVYRVVESWSDAAGRDFMGALPHKHVQRRDLTRFQSQGLDAF